MIKKFALTVISSAMLLGLTACDKDANANNAATAPAAQNTAAQNTEAVSPSNDMDFNQKVSVALGTLYGDQLAMGIKETADMGFKVDLKLLNDAFAKSVNGQPTSLSIDESKQVIQEFSMQMMKKQQEKDAKVAAENAEIGKKFLEENKTKEGVVTTESGLQYKIITQGNGAKPSKEDYVRVTYKGTNVDGSEFDSSSEPVEFQLTNVIVGWQEGLQLMNVGSKAMLYIPAELAYGAGSPSPAIKPNSTLIFEVELLDIVSQDKPAEAPEAK